MIVLPLLVEDLTFACVCVCGVLSTFAFIMSTIVIFLHFIGL